MPSTLRKQAIAYLGAGDAKEARRLLQAAIRQEPRDELTWLWYVETLTTDAERIRALERCLRICPDSQRARIALSRLGTRAAKTPARRPQVAAERRPARRVGGGLILATLVALVVMTLCAWSVARPVHGLLYVPRQDHEALAAQHSALLDRQADLERRHGELADTHRTLVRAHDELESRHGSLVAEHSALIVRYATLEQAHTSLSAAHDRLQADHEALSAEHQTLRGEHASLQRDYAGLRDQYDWLSEQAVTPPYITIEGRTVHMAFYSTDGATHRWEIPFDALETAIQRGYRKRESWPSRVPTVSLEYDDGRVIRDPDFRVFVDPSAFETVMSELYGGLQSAPAFVYEVWSIVTQLTTYSSEIGETPRYPLETLLAGGGDCEDTAILFASMVKAAPVDWSVQLVYMDSENPLDPVRPNHVMVYVDTGIESYLVETTGGTDMQPYEYVDGWYLEVE